jgi:hypothetical protein
VFAGDAYARAAISLGIETYDYSSRLLAVDTKLTCEQSETGSRTVIRRPQRRTEGVSEGNNRFALTSMGAISFQLQPK